MGPPRWIVGTSQCIALCFLRRSTCTRTYGQIAADVYGAGRSLMPNSAAMNSLTTSPPPISKTGCAPTVSARTAMVMNGQQSRSKAANWVRHAQADRTKGKTGLTTAEREELARLRKGSASGIDARP